MKHLRQLIQVASLAILLVVHALGRDPVWEEMEAPQLRLTIRDKLNVYHSYEVKFTIYSTTPGSLNKPLFSRTVHVDQNRPGSVIFPDDFLSKHGSSTNQLLRIAPGVYNWGAEVDGKDVGGGQFEVIVNGGGVRIVG